jgi:hypothetical protein
VGRGRDHRPEPMMRQYGRKEAEAGMRREAPGNHGGLPWRGDSDKMIPNVSGRYTCGNTGRPGRPAIGWARAGAYAGKDAPVTDEGGSGSTTLRGRAA